MATTAEGRSEPRFKLIYYPFRGRAELIRFVFAQLEIAYVDERISVEEWAKRKPGTVQALSMFLGKLLRVKIF